LAAFSFGCLTLRRICVSGSWPSDTINPPFSEMPDAAANAVIELMPGSVEY